MDETTVKWQNDGSTNVVFFGTGVGCLVGLKRRHNTGFELM
jgi:hypothetical protein